MSQRNFFIISLRRPDCLLIYQVGCPVARRRPILIGVPSPPEAPFFKSGLFRGSGVILTLFVSAVFHEKREIDLFPLITRHKLPETLIFASVYERFTSVSPNRANRPLTDRESRLRSGYGACVPTAGSMDRGAGGLHRHYNEPGNSSLASPGIFF